VGGAVILERISTAMMHMVSSRTQMFQSHCALEPLRTLEFGRILIDCEQTYSNTLYV
jgi:hypothetical protein